MKTIIRKAWPGALLAVGLVPFARAGVTGVEVRQKSTVAAGKAFGSAGSYTSLTGTVRFVIDPKHPRNRKVIDIQFAPVNPKGLVEFSADVFILRPTDLRKGNGTVLFEVVNRGKKGMLATFNRARSSNNPSTAEDMGDGFLLNAGYTLVWVGWQHDVPRGDGFMRLEAPAASGVKGLVRSEYTPDKPGTLIPLGDAGHIPYPVTPGTPLKVTVRDEIDGERTEIPATGWSLEPSGVVKLSSPTTPGRIYEVIYESANPAISGLGPVAIRDLISYLKRDHRRAIGFGTSQSAMVLRGLVYEGFNQDEQGKMVLDGIFAHVAGARRSTFQRFVQASRTAGPLRNASLSTTEQFPFSDRDQVDPVTGKLDGVLHAATAAKQVPKVFYTNSAYEYWGSAASLLHTTPDGRKDAAVPASTRIYMFAGGQHGPGAFPPKMGNGLHFPNFNDYKWSLRALMTRMQNWIEKDEQPPASTYPSIANGTLTTPETYRFPVVPGVTRPGVIHTPASLDFGAEYAAKGFISKEPPQVVKAYQALVPQSDGDGNDLGGMRMPEVGCALGSFTGWNLRNKTVGNTRYLLGQTGSYIPFPWTKADRQTSGDARASVEDRFAGQTEYLACVEKRAAELVKGGLLLPSDTEPIKQAAIRHWKWRSENSKVPSASASR